MHLSTSLSHLGKCKKELIMAAILLTGATGWLGQETIDLISENPDLVAGAELVLFASRSGNIELVGKSFEVKSLDSIVDYQAGEVAGVVHLAFLTRDKVKKMSTKDYIYSNHQISSQVSNLIRKTKPRWVVTVSSGAIYNSEGNLEDDLDSNPYGYCKKVEETLLREACEEVSSNLVVGRLWGAMGRNMPLNRNYAVSDFIQSALINSEISINSGTIVERRYVNAAEFMELLIKIATSGTSKTLDSGGPLIEIGELSKLIAERVQGVTIRRSTSNLSREDFYFPKQSEYEELSEIFKVNLSSIEDLVEITIKSHQKLLELKAQVP